MKQDSLFIRSNREWHRIKQDEILYIKSRGNLSLIVLAAGKVILTNESFAELQERLPGNFFRAHRSFIINLDKIDRLCLKIAHIGEYGIPIGSTRLDALFTVLGINMGKQLASEVTFFDTPD